MNNLLGLQIETLKKFGVSKEDSEIYLHLLENGMKTVSELRKDSRAGLSKVRSSISRLKKHQLIYEVRNEKGRFIAASNPQSLGSILVKKKEDIVETKSLFESVYSDLLELSYGDQKQSKILHYVGIEGLKQVMWNSSSAKESVRLLELESMSNYLDFGFYEKIREIFVKNGVKYYEITNTNEMSAWTNVTQFIKNWQAKYINPKELNIKFETMIYDDVVAIYNSGESGIFCIEIHNAKLAKMQKQLFDFIWKRSQEMEITDKVHGACKVKK